MAGEMMLRDYGIKAESTLVMTKMGLVINVTNPKVGLEFVSAAET